MNGRALPQKRGIKGIEDDSTHHQDITRCKRHPQQGIELSAQDDNNSTADADDTDDQ